MKLDLISNYKSLTPISIELPDFTILTGINGAGKTQLLTGLIEGKITLTENGVELNPKKYVASYSLAPNESLVITKEQLNNNIRQIWNTYNQYLTQLKTNPNLIIENVFRDTRQLAIIRYVAKETNKQINELTSDDIYQHYPLDDGYQNDIFYQNFSSLFKRYQDKLDDNEYRQYRHEILKRREIEFLTGEQFIEKYGEAPWVFVNKILKEAKLDYHINSPLNSHREASFELKLINDSNEAEIQFNELSSGEKVLMSLALALYNSNFDIVFPKVLLMDEPNASLHPSMTKQFLNVIENIFVKDKKVKVIITTHSPSTVALSPESALFVMNKTGNRIKKTTKDKALKILTAGVPSLSINYENRRQVFVESKYDVFFYEEMYDKLSLKLVDEISLDFISSGVSGAGNSAQVKEVVNKLSSYGNKFIFGIIDWDKENSSNKYVKVLGENKRYSIENYIFDPILVSALLLREKIITREDLGLSNNENYSDFKNLSLHQLQIISNFLINKIFPEINPSDNTLLKARYVNGIEMDIPRWYLFYQGHELETLLKKIFPPLRKHIKEGDLKKEVITKVIDDIPELISNDILELFLDIQNYSG